MRRLLSLMMAALVIYTGTVGAQERRDGNWWRSGSIEYRLGYAIGLIDGAGRLNDAIEEAARRVDPEAMKQRGPQARLAVLKASSILPGVTSGQLMDGIDQFYADATNRLIHPANAGWVVLNRIAGMPSNELEPIVEALRRDARR
jgi:hypothetical protein